MLPLLVYELRRPSEASFVPVQILTFLKGLKRSASSRSFLHNPALSSQKEQVSQVFCSHEGKVEKSEKEDLERFGDVTLRNWWQPAVLFEYY